jgi:hypothetical protein
MLSFSRPYTGGPPASPAARAAQLPSPMMNGMIALRGICATRRHDDERLNIPRCKSLQIKGEKRDPDELLKTKGQNKKDVKNEGSSG